MSKLTKRMVRTGDLVRFRSGRNVGSVYVVLGVFVDDKGGWRVDLTTWPVYSVLLNTSLFHVERAGRPAA